MNTQDTLQSLINVLIRVKNCDKALDILKCTSKNSIFDKDQIYFDFNDKEIRDKILQHIHDKIKECIEIIERE